jgi:hypothetical protein
MIDPTWRDRLIAVYATWVDQDDFGQRIAQICRPRQDAGVSSVRQFLEELLQASSGPNALIERPAALDHPDSTFLHLLGSPLVTQAGPRGLVESVAHHALCLQPIPRLLVEATGHQHPTGNDVQPHVEPTGSITGDDRDVIAQGSIDETERLELADALMAVLKDKLGHRTIRSFFTVDVAGNGYRLWNEHLRAASDSGTALARHSIQTDAGHVSVDLLRYADEEQTRVRAYEWCAELREDLSSELPDAIAYGMAYCFARHDGMPIGGKWELMTAADCLADVDLLQVNAFFDQHEDGEALIDEGDLAFVWLWERRSGTRPGVGQACLWAALTDLCRRLRRIRTIVIDLKPYQYVVSDGAGTPAAVHLEKLDAVDHLQAFVDGLHLDHLVNGHCRYIVNRDGDNPDAAMRVLGFAGLAQQDAPWQDGG